MESNKSRQKCSWKLAEVLQNGNQLNGIVSPDYIGPEVVWLNRFRLGHEIQYLSLKILLKLLFNF
jgi:hypothetical protein